MTTAMRRVPQFEDAFAETLASPPASNKPHDEPKFGCYFVCDPGDMYGFVYTWGHGVDYIALNVAEEHWPMCAVAMDKLARYDPDFAPICGDVCNIGGVKFFTTELAAAIAAKLWASCRNPAASRHLRTFNVISVEGLDLEELIE